jgi:hypothetical protein
MNESVERILQWPKGTRSPQEERELVEYRRGVYAEIRALIEQTEREDRNLTADEAEHHAQLQAEYDRLTSEVPSAA